MKNFATMKYLENSTPTNKKDYAANSTEELNLIYCFLGNTCMLLDIHNHFQNIKLPAPSIDRECYQPGKAWIRLDITLITSRIDILNVGSDDGLSIDFYLKCSCNCLAELGHEIVLTIQPWSSRRIPCMQAVH